MLWASNLTTDRVIQIVSVATKTIKSFGGGGTTQTTVRFGPELVEYEAPRELQSGRQIPYRAMSLVGALVSLYVGRTKARRTRLGTIPSLPLRKAGLTVIVGWLLKYIAQVLMRRYKSPIGASLTTKIVKKSLTAGKLSSSAQRQVFVETPLVQSRITQNHTHGESARDRNAGSHTAALVARSLGLQPYYVQKSLSDVRKGRDGDRSYHWAKDVAVPSEDFHFDCLEQAAVLVDVDHYIDMPLLLAQHPGTYLISTFQPTAAAKSEGEFTYRFNENGEVEYEVSGGALYTHKVWDYRGDTFLVEDVGFIKKTVVSYHIDRKRLNDHHTLIMLTQIGRFELPSAVPTSTVLEGARLKRLEPVFGGHVVLDVVTQEGRSRSVAVLGQHTSVTLPKSQFDAVHAVAVVAKVPITPAMVASNIAPSDPAGLPTERLPPGHAAIISSYLRAGVPRYPPVVFPPSEALLPIYFAKHDYDAPVPLKAFGSPLIGPCYSYSQSIAGDDRCISGRVEQFIERDEPEGELPIPPSLAGYMAEFAEFCIPVAHRGHPVGHDEVRERQSKPSQRSILETQSVSGDNTKDVVRAFVKKETAVKPSDPRNISQMPRKLDYATVMYAFHDGVMTEQEWYAFGVTPAECAQRVCDILKDAEHSVLADGSRFDGHVKRRARILERILMLRFFASEHHDLVNETMDAQIGLPGVTTEGRRYASGYGRGSGSQETSDFNSVLTAFIDYCAWRNTTVNGEKCSPQTAWAKLGVYGGDDSLAGAVDPAALKRSSEMMGQKYEIVVINRGSIGVEFLNRRFGPDVWNGDPSSMANPSRLLAKLWTGPAHLVAVLERFAERCSGYYRMDANSPVVGQIVRAAHELLGERVEGRLTPWYGQFSRETNWPNEDSGWMIDVFNASIPDFDYDRFQAWIDEVYATGNAELLLQAPLCTAAATTPPVAKQTCVIGDELHIVDPVPKDKGKEEERTSEVWKFTDEELVDTDCIPASVRNAAKSVPIVGTNGLKARNKPKKVAARTAPAPCSHTKRTNKETGATYTCPCQWSPPKKKDDEPQPVFAERLSQWKQLRKKVARKHGLTIV